GESLRKVDLQGIVVAGKTRPGFDKPCRASGDLRRQARTRQTGLRCAERQLPPHVAYIADVQEESVSEVSLNHGAEGLQIRSWKFTWTHHERLIGSHETISGNGRDDKGRRGEPARDPALNAQYGWIESRQSERYGEVVDSVTRPEH